MPSPASDYPGAPGLLLLKLVQVQLRANCSFGCRLRGDPIAGLDLAASARHNFPALLRGAGK